MRPDALIFDLDGTLIDSAADLAATLNALLAEYNRPELSLAAVRAMIGDGIGALVARGFAATGEAIAGEEHQGAAGRFLALYTEPGRVHVAPAYPGVEAVLRGFRDAGIPMGVCTNKAQAASELVLREAGILSYFEAVIGHDRAPRPKPDPTHVQAASAALGNPAAAIMIGDSNNDLRAGQGAGLPVILVRYGYGTPEALAAADAVVENFAEIPAAIERL